MLNISRIQTVWLSALLICFGVTCAAKPPVEPVQQKTSPPQVKVVENGESKARPEDCRGIIVGPGINQPDPFPGYAGFVGWESPIRLRNGTWLVGFNAGYWHASVSTPMQYSPAHLQ